MSEIKVLENNLINKIAAGEVVERPLNVIKELVENSIDAGATKIDVEIKNGGLTSMVIIDNGSGIERSFVRTAFLRHATSKIRDIDDLTNIMTLGFRGEALSSISSVSEVVLTTRTKEDELGIELTLINGEVIEEKAVNSPIGTKFVVNNLFFNVPARLKFLKKPSVEAGMVSDIMTSFILANPTIEFKYFVNNSKTLHSKGKGLKQAFFDVYGRDIHKNSMENKYESDLIKIHGVLGLPSISRGNRKNTNFFINGRYIKSDILNEAVKEGYGTRLMVGRFPLCAIHLHIDPENVDVNVHPTKLEVRFSNEDMIYKLVYDFVIQSLEDSENNISSSAKLQSKKDFVKPIFENNTTEYIPIDFEEAIEVVEEDIPTNFHLDIEKDVTLTLQENDEDIVDEKPSVSDIIYNNQEKEEMKKAFREEYKQEKIKNETCENLQEIKPQTRENTQEIKPIAKENIVRKKPHNFKIIGQLFNTYWILEKDDTMFLLDQHAGHERLIYERYKRDLKNANVVSQQVLEPKTIVLSFHESVFVRDNIDKFQSLGFEVEEFGENIFAIRAFPMIFDKVEDLGFFYEILKDFKKGENLYDFKDDVVISKSCKAAIKANHSLEYLEAKKLIDDILNENLTCCPHGRPIFVEISKKEIEKMFKRIV